MRYSSQLRAEDTMYVIHQVIWKDGVRLWSIERRTTYSGAVVLSVMIISAIVHENEEFGTKIWQQSLC